VTDTTASRQRPHLSWGLTEAAVSEKIALKMSAGETQLQWFGDMSEEDVLAQQPRKDQMLKDDFVQMKASFYHHLVNLNDACNVIMPLVKLGLILTQVELDVALAFARSYFGACVSMVTSVTFWDSHERFRKHCNWVDRIEPMGRWWLDYTIERNQFMRVLGRLMRDPSKADSVDIVRVLELLFDPDKLLMQLRSNDTISRDFHRWILSLTSS
jgi:hypothetical protein